MKVLFIHRLFTLTTLGREPLGMLYLAAALKRAGHQVELADADSFSRMVKMIESFRPHILAYPVIRTGFHQFYLSLNRRLQKQRRIPTVWGGPHPTFLPQMIEEEGVDYICRGEGEEAFCDLLNRLESGRAIGTVANFWIKTESGSIRRNHPRPLIPDLSRLPFPERELLYRHAAWKRFPVKSFLASRGCPYSCSYCYNPPLRKLYGNPDNYVRRRSVDNLLAEIRQTRDSAPLQFVQFEDDLFPLEEKWLKTFSQSYPAQIGLPFAINARPESIRPPTVTRLKQAGCYSINLGLESANPRLRSLCLNRRTSDAEILNAARLIRAKGIRLILEVMLGLPQSELEDDLLTLQMAARCQPDYCIASLFQPYPGTVITQTDFYRKHYPPPDYNRLDSFYSFSPLPLKKKREVENLMRMFALAVAGRFPLAWVKRIIHYPLSPLYTLLFFSAKIILIKRNLLPVRFKFLDYLLNFRALFHK